MSTKVGEIFLDIISIEEDFESNLDEELPICQIEWLQKLILDTFPV